MDKNSKIYVAGHTGLVGGNLVNKLKEQGYTNIITTNRQKYNLISEEDVDCIFRKNAPEFVFLCAAKVGGINANNKYPADFITTNSMIQTNIIKACYDFSVEKLLFLGSSCIYPRNCQQPIKEEYFMTGALEQTNSAYAIAKIAGIEMCRAYNKQYGTNFIAAMPCNIIGVGDHFDLESSHVLSALIKKIDDAKKYNKEFVEVWGTGKPMREFLFAEDLAEGLIFLMNNYNATANDNLINIGSGFDISINDLAIMIKDIIGYKGNIIYNSIMPDGTPRKLMDSSKINNLGWKARFTLEDGIIKTYEYYKTLL